LVQPATRWSGELCRKARYAGDIWQFESGTPHPEEDSAQPARRENQKPPCPPWISYPVFHKKQKRKHSGSIPEALRKRETHFSSKNINVSASAAKKFQTAK
jgi:hypothetical protein